MNSLIYKALAREEEVSANSPPPGYLQTLQSPIVGDARLALNQAAIPKYPGFE